MLRLCCGRKRETLGTREDATLLRMNVQIPKVVEFDLNNILSVKI